MTVTNPTGRSFVSYRRARKNDISMLVACQNEQGIPTWLDLPDLGEGPTEEQIAAVLTDPSTANSVLWLTPEVADSSFIKKVEVPLVISRFDAGDEFFVATIAAGGLNYSTAADCIRDHTGLHDISGWNIHSVNDPLTLADARDVASRVLRARIEAVNRATPSDEALRIRLWVRQPAPFELGYALSMDWNHLFDGRHAGESVWQSRLIPPLGAAIGAIEHFAPGRRIVASGRLTICAAVALGTTCLAPRQIDISWAQFTPGKGEEEWSLTAVPEPSQFSHQLVSGTTDSDELAVLVSVSDDVGPAFTASRRELPSFRAVLNITRDARPPHILENAGQAVDVARHVTDAVRTTRQELKLLGGVHFFMAIPVGLGMLLGQLLNTLGEVHLYELASVDGVGRYRHELTLRPSG